MSAIQMRGVDISNNNGAGIVNDSRVINAKFVIGKCTEGLTFTDQTYRGFQNTSRQRGQLWGSYHFAHWANDPVQEARRYKSLANWSPGDTFWLDWEMYGSQAGCPAGTHGPWVAAFLREIPTCGLYTNSDMMNKI